MAKLSRRSEQLAKELNCAPEDIAELLRFSSAFVALKTKEQIDKFITEVVKSSAAGSLKDYYAQVVENTKNNKLVSLPKSKVGINVPSFSITIEAPKYHKRIKNTSGKGRDHLHVFDLLDEGRPALPGNKKPYTLHNMLPQPRTSTSERDPSNKRKRAQIGVAKDGKPIYADVPSGSILTDKAKTLADKQSRVLSRPEPRSYLQTTYKRALGKAQDVAYNLPKSTIKSMLSSDSRYLAAKQAIDQAEKERSEALPESSLLETLKEQRKDNAQARTKLDRQIRTKKDQLQRIDREIRALSVEMSELTRQTKIRRLKIKDAYEDANSKTDDPLSPINKAKREIADLTESLGKASPARKSLINLQLDQARKRLSLAEQIYKPATVDVSKDKEELSKLRTNKLTKYLEVRSLRDKKKPVLEEIRSLELQEDNLLEEDKKITSRIKSIKQDPKELAKLDAKVENAKNKANEIKNAIVDEYAEQLARKRYTEALKKRNKKSGLEKPVFRYGPIRAVPARNLYKRALKQVKDKLQIKNGFQYWDVIFAKNIQASTVSRDR